NSQLLGDIELDRTAQCARRQGRDLRLGLREFQLLELLMSQPGKVFSRGDIKQVTYGDNSVDLRTIDMMVVRLRKQINRSTQPDPIRTVFGVGYKFSEHYERELAAWSSHPPKKLRLEGAQLPRRASAW